MIEPMPDDTVCGCCSNQCCHMSNVMLPIELLQDLERWHKAKIALGKCEALLEWLLMYYLDPSTEHYERTLKTLEEIRKLNDGKIEVTNVLA